MEETWKFKKRLQYAPSNSIISTGTEAWRIVMETTVKHRASVNECSSQSIGASIVQSNSLIEKQNV